MELKYINPNYSEIVVASKLNFVKTFLLIAKIELKNEPYKSFFEKDALIAPKTRYFITFTSLIHM